MKDIPLFTTENGAASLGLRQIPYRREAYIRLQASAQPEELLKECVSFSLAVGAEHVYAVGDGIEEGYPLYTRIIRMERLELPVPIPHTTLCPVNEANLEDWRGIYNSRMEKVPGAVWMTREDAAKARESGCLYFIYEEDLLLGIGMLRGREVLGLAAIVPGGGSKILQTLLHAIPSGAAILEVASKNEKAVNLYKSFGFTEKEIITAWYKII